MKNKLELNKRDSDYLTALPEQGMGYQLVTLTLKSGIVLKHRVVVNSTYLILHENERLNVDDIESLSIDYNNI